MQIYLDTGALVWAIGGVCGIAVVTFVMLRVRQFWAIVVGVLIGACMLPVIAWNGYFVTHTWAVLKNHGLSYMDASGHVSHLDIRSIQGMKVGIYCDFWCATIYEFRTPDERRVEQPATQHDASVPRLARVIAERAGLRGPTARMNAGSPEWDWNR